MVFTVDMCHSHLLFMLLNPIKFEDSVISYTSSSPNLDSEGFNGYMQIKCEFKIKDLVKFSELWESYYKFNQRSEFYGFIRFNKINNVNLGGIYGLHS